MEAKTHGSTERTIVYSKEDHDYAAYLGSEFIGSYRSHLDAEVALDGVALDLLEQDARALTSDIRKLQDKRNETLALVDWNR